MSKQFLTLAGYWMGRDKAYPFDLSTEIRKEAELTVSLVNDLLVAATLHGANPETNPGTGTVLTSGWRPPAINGKTAGAAPRSHHMAGRAADIYDPDGDLDEWLMTNEGQKTLKRLGLWMEHPAATKGWCHVQTRPPRSGNRVFYP